jgi:hypothetical protein
MADEPRAELREWYLESLRPKLAAAAAAGTVRPRAAAELDRQLRDLLELEASCAVRLAAPVNA